MEAEDRSEWEQAQLEELHNSVISALRMFLRALWEPGRAAEDLREIANLLENDTEFVASLISAHTPASPAELDYDPFDDFDYFDEEF